MKTDIAIILSILSILFTLTTAIFSVLAYSKVVGMEKSTHQVVQQMVPLDFPDSPSEELGPTGKELDKQMSKAFGYEDLDQDQI